MPGYARHHPEKPPGIGGAVSKLKVNPAPAHPHRQRQLAPRVRPLLKLPVEPFGDPALKPGPRQIAWRQQPLSPPNLERHIGQCKRAREVMLRRPAQGFRPHCGARRGPKPPDLAKVEQGRKAPVSPVQHQMKQLIGGAHHQYLQTRGQLERHSPAEELAHRNPVSRMAEAKVQLNAGPGRMLHCQMMISGQRIGDGCFPRIPFGFQKLCRPGDVPAIYRQVQIGRRLSQKRGLIVPAREQRPFHRQDRHAAGLENPGRVFQFPQIPHVSVPAAGQDLIAPGAFGRLHAGAGRERRQLSHSMPVSVALDRCPGCRIVSQAILAIEKRSEEFNR